MFYAIDFDSLNVDVKSEFKTQIARYIKDNELELAVCIVANVDELTLNFTLHEMQDLYSNLGSKSKIFNEEDEAANAVLNLLNEHQSQFKKCSKRKTIKPKLDLSDKYFIVGSKTPRIGSLSDKIIKFIDDNLGEVSTEELSIFKDETIIEALNKNHIEEAL